MFNHYENKKSLQKAYNLLVKRMCKKHNKRHWKVETRWNSINLLFSHTILSQISYFTTNKERWGGGHLFSVIEILKFIITSIYFLDKKEEKSDGKNNTDRCLLTKKAIINNYE